MPWHLFPLLLFVFHADGLIPKFQITQDRDTIYVSIEVRCDETPEVNMTADTFHFACTATGKSYNMTFQLREDIIPHQSDCISNVKFGSEDCALLKKHPHMFDRYLENPKPFKRYMREGYGGDDFEVSDDEYDTAFLDSDVEVLDPKQLNTTLEHQDFVVFYAGYRWCHRCRTAHAHIIDLARRLKGKIPFAAVDVVEDRFARAFFNPSCDVTCLMYVYRRGEGIYPFFQSGSFAKSTKVLLGYLPPLFTNVTSEAELEEFARQAPSRVVGVFADLDGPEAQTLRTVAMKYRAYLRFALATQPFDSLAPIPSIQFFWPDRPPAVYKGDLLTAKDIVRFLEFNSRPRVMKFTDELQNQLRGVEFPGVLFWTDEDTPEQSAELEAIMAQLSEEMEGRFYFVQLDNKTDLHIQARFGGWNVTVALQSSFDLRGEYWVHEGPLTLEALRETLWACVAGNLTTWVSEPVPEEAWEPGKVKKVVRRTLNEEISGPQTVLIGFYKPYSKDAHIMLRVLEHIASFIAVVPDVVVATFDVTRNNPPTWLPPSPFDNSPEWFATRITGMPTIVILPPGADPANPKYIWHRNQPHYDLVMEFMKAYIPALEEHWDAVEARVQEVREERERELQKLQEEDRKRREEEEARAAKSAKTEMVDVTGDGGVVKQPKNDGEGDLPEMGAIIELHYIGILVENGQEFNNSWTQGNPVRFTLGAREVIRCWEEVVATMRVAEHAIVTCEPKYAYGTKGQPPSIPRDASLQYDIHIIAITNPAGEEDEEPPIPEVAEGKARDEL